MCISSARILFHTRIDSISTGSIRVETTTKCGKYTKASEKEDERRGEEDVEITHDDFHHNSEQSFSYIWVLTETVSQG